MEATKIQNENGTFTYKFGEEVFKKASKREYNYMLIAKPSKIKGATNDGKWYAAALGNNPRTIVSSWKGILGHCDLEVISIN